MERTCTKGTDHNHNRCILDNEILEVCKLFEELTRHGIWPGSEDVFRLQEIIKTLEAYNGS